MRRLAAVLGSAVALLVPTATAVSAAPAGPVDQVSLTPALNPALTWTCKPTGRGPICTGVAGDSYAEAFEDLTCDGQQLYIRGSFTDNATRWHNRAGEATKTEGIRKSVEYVSLSPDGQGTAVKLRSVSVRHYDYAVPGDPRTRVLTETGATQVATAAGSGVLFHDVGLIRYLPGFDFEIADVVRGPHDLYASEGELFLPALCEALTD